MPNAHTTRSTDPDGLRREGPRMSGPEEIKDQPGDRIAAFLLDPVSRPVQQVQGSEVGAESVLHAFESFRVPDGHPSLGRRR